MFVARRALEESCEEGAGAKRKPEENSRFPTREVVHHSNRVVQVALTELICPAIDASCRLIDVVRDATLAIGAKRLRHAPNGARDASKCVARPRLLVCDLLIGRVTQGLADATCLRRLCPVFR